MAVDFRGAELLLFSEKLGVSFSRTLTIGRQHVAIPPAGHRIIEQSYGAHPSLRQRGEAAFADKFFQEIGAKQIESLDFSDYQGATLLHDLNAPIPEAWHDRYDAVFDGGSLEHIFNFPQAIRNCMSLVKPGGHFMTVTPANNWLGHGFYQFSPELYFRVFSPENGFEVVRVFLASAEPGGKMFRVEDPAKVGSRVGVVDDQPTVLLLLARRSTEKMGFFESVPQQSDYSTRWESSDADGTVGTRGQGIKAAMKSVIPEPMLEWARQRAIQKRHREESQRGLEAITSLA